MAYFDISPTPINSPSSIAFTQLIFSFSRKNDHNAPAQQNNRGTSVEINVEESEIPGNVAKVIAAQKPVRASNNRTVVRKMRKAVPE